MLAGHLVTQTNRKSRNGKFQTEGLPHARFSLLRLIDSGLMESDSRLMELVTEPLSVDAQVWEFSVTKWTLPNRMVRAGDSTGKNLLITLSRRYTT